MSIWKKFQRFLFPSKQERLFTKDIASIIGRLPKNLNLYKLATLHSSVGKLSKKGFRVSNERLEFLGDAILNMVIAEFLFKKFPYENEGFLTEIRSRIVRRATLNKLALKIGITELVELQDKNHKKRKNSIYGNALEALIGAVYLDRGYTFCKGFILKRIVQDHLDLQKIIHTDSNYKSKIIEWAQKENKEILFESFDEVDGNNANLFEVSLIIDQERISTGKGTSKKRAEQNAALEACQKLELL
ncbi:MAG: ribonuclease 3 [Cyclobacteriaceae bacterium]|nr:MAG: ribonuclease 3 [Cyclobacteriaceae bacterium]